MTPLTWKDRYAFAQAALLAAEGIANGEILPVWIDNTNFWYERRGSYGAEYVVVNASTGDRRIIATRQQLSAALSEQFRVAIDPELLIIANVRVELSHRAFAFTVCGEAYKYDWETGALT